MTKLIYAYVKSCSPTTPETSECNLPQAANLLCAQANSASYLQQEWKWIVTYELRGEGLTRVVVWLRAAPRVQLFVKERSQVK